MRDISQRLVQIRISQNKTQQEVADNIGVQVSAYKNYEHNRRTPALESLIKLADCFNVSIDYLVGRSKINTN